ncbi:MBL fold metallo-hydrolase [Sphingomonas sp. SM33]|uniref:MBL fold metallo-hydrolase n=1 Tax=Sphingomonas telluris TaxID=2907998 RepID=A0ABS9VK81_9SPHN|nr:MBL fold metallo-hydrolase [Sphingomonas telluris]
MKIRILGCGTSFGVPRIGNDWGECDPNEPRNRRTRSSILIESDGERLLVDCGPDLREQLLAAEIGKLDGVIVTHDHADHCHGIDELRAIEQRRGEPVPLHARAQVLESLQKRFSYIFSSRAIYRTVAEAVELAAMLDLGKAQLRFVDQPHGGITSVGMRIEEEGRSAVYAIDFSDLTDEMRSLYEGADVWISDCLSRRPHPTHAHLDAVLGWAREMNVGQLYLSHLNNSMDYRSLLAELPDWAAPAHDGLEIVLS